MPASSLLALLDDIAALLDDVAVMTKVAAKKTAGVLGDDLALNAQQVAGVRADRELPVVWAVAKGSTRNKLILVPAALLISAFAPWGVTPLLMAGGAFLCFEGFEKLAHARSRGTNDTTGTATAAADRGGSVESDKIKGAVRTDFILSAEIIAITLGVVAGTPLVDQVAVLSLTALGMTVGVYGLVAAIVKLDDGGLALSRRSGTGGGAVALRAFGRFVVAAAPWLMKALSVAGTAAMFLVGGGILVHGIAALHGPVEALVAAAAGLPGVGGVAGPLAPTLLNGAAGVLAGAVVYAVVTVAQRALRRR